MIENQKNRVIGLMSGTSMDGLDIVDVTFQQNKEQKWSFVINNAQLITYDSIWTNKLIHAPNLSAPNLMQLSSELGVFYAEQVNQFISSNHIPKEEILLIASHGQTIFHRPELGYTLQIGNGPELAVNTGLPAVVDFRTKDVALGGNGAPFIPVADFLLFDKYADSFLNLGGFSNFSFKENQIVHSFDICPVNIVVNYLVQSLGLSFDENGEIGETGKVNTEILTRLNNLDYYTSLHPKSLGWEWVSENVLPILDKRIDVKDKVRTYYEHIAFQIGRVINQTAATSVLITGGGAKNFFLLSRMQEYIQPKMVLPSNKIIDFKEAIGFAFLGLLRWQNKVNVWASVTGAKQDSSSGVITLP